jgi:hypothetical protein
VRKLSEVSLNIPDSAWDAADYGVRNAQLLTTLYLNGVPHHVMALQVRDDDVGIQCFVDPDHELEYAETLQSLYSGYYATVDITPRGGSRGTYVVVVHPYAS